MIFDKPELKPSNLPIESLSSSNRTEIESFLQELLFPEKNNDHLNNNSKDNNNNNEEVILPPADRLNTSLDDEGNTPLHWLSSVAHVSLVRKLVNGGADPCIGCNRGETPLMRAVSVANNYDAGTFEQLLDILSESLFCVDKLNRTILHHIVLSTNVPACSSSAKYYLDILMGWIVRNLSNNLKWVLQVMLPCKDKNGETVLDIAERLRCQPIIEALKEYGASENTNNNNGGNDLNIDNNGLNNNNIENEQQNNNNINNKINDINSIVGELKDILDRVENEHEIEIKESKESYKDVQNKLNIVKKQLAIENERLSKAKRLNEQSLSLNEQINSIKKYKNEIDQEVYNNNEEDDFNMDDIPIKIQIEAYKESQKVLDERLNKVINEKNELESKFRRVLSLCLKVEEDKVDSMLDGLLQAIEGENNDENSTGEMQEFLQRHGNNIVNTGI